ncbi:putative Arv1 protein [Rosa chinensis]|uniref:Protein ARV n=1 Tax=Rosa chinensis TaxID=74649 RepID=A0A2P6SC69_ROSCH|nr:putative Arv1 protein [Rosa chinensis]
MIILIDLILHKKKAYTHLLYNVIDSQAPAFQGLVEFSFRVSSFGCLFPF